MHNLFKLKPALLALAMVLTPTLIYGQTQSGTLDTSFGSGGKAINDFGGRIALLPNGKIVAAGGAANPTDGFDFAVFQFNANGTPDTTFGSGGRTTTDLGADLRARLPLPYSPTGKSSRAGTPLSQ